MIFDLMTKLIPGLFAGLGHQFTPLVIGMTILERVVVRNEEQAGLGMVDPAARLECPEQSYGRGGARSMGGYRGLLEAIFNYSRPV